MCALRTAQSGLQEDCFVLTVLIVNKLDLFINKITFVFLILHSGTYI